MTSVIAAVDLGGTRLRAAVVDAHGNIVRRAEAPTAHELSSPEQLPALVREVIADQDVTEAVVGLPGRVDYGRGRLVFARNLPPAWLAYLSTDWLSDKTGLKISLAGDAELAAVGEAYFGAGTSEGDTAYVTFSTGVGAAALTAGQLLHTRQTGFQLGLVPVATFEGELVDALASGQQIQRYADQRGRAVGSAQELLRLADGGDAEAARVWQNITEYASWVAVLICHVVCPDVLVVGGGLSTTGPRLVAPLRSALRRHGPQGLERPIHVTTSARGDDAGLAGAAAWGLAMAGTKEKP